jgi:hypothetical protein
LWSYCETFLKRVLEGKPVKTLREDVQREIERIRVEVLPVSYANTAIHQSIDEAIDAIAHGEESSLRYALADLKGWQS